MGGLMNRVIRAVAVGSFLAATTFTWMSGVPPVSAASPLSLSCNTALVPIPGLDEVIPIDLGTREPGVPIHLAGAYMITVSPDATTAWVISDNATAPVWTLTPIDLTSGDVGASLTLDALPGAGPVSAPVVTPDGNHILIGSSDFLMVIDLATMTIEPLIPYPSGFRGAQVSITPDGTTVLVGTNDGFDIRTVDFASRLVDHSIATPGSPAMVAISADGRTAYGANRWDQSVSPIDLGTLTVGASLPSIPGGELISLDPDGAFAALLGSAGIATLDLASGSISPVIPITNRLGQTLTPDGTTDLVLTQVPDQLVPVDLVSRTPGVPIPLPGTALTVAAVAPGQAPTADLTADPAVSGKPTRFDASGSTAACGDITSYTWDFGDGSTPMTLSTPSVEHTYAAAGDYTATVAVTDSTGTSTAKVFTGMTMSRNGGPQAESSVQVAIAPGAPDPVAVAPGFTG